MFGDFGLARLGVDAPAQADQITALDETLELHSRDALALQPSGSGERMRPE